MKKSICLSAFVFCTLISHAQNKLHDFFISADKFLHSFAHDGRVDYTTLKKQPGSIKMLCDQIAAMDISQADSLTHLAFYINVYNLYVINRVVENYPVKSVSIIQGFFDNKSQKVAGEKLTLNELERKKLLEFFHDPRIHFVLCNSAEASPPLINKAYMPFDVDSLLNLQAKTFINKNESTLVNYEKKSLHISPIFEWYEKDFTARGSSIIQFLNLYRGKIIPVDFKKVYYQFNWNLNEWKK